VPVEIIFDQGVGDLFVVRVAGNFENSAAAGTFEYGVAALGVHTVVVLGHTKCGAVEAALAGKALPGDMPVFTAAVAPAIAAMPKPAAKPQGADGKPDLTAAVEANVRWQLDKLLERSEILRKAKADGKLTVYGAIYDVDTGRVRFLD
jgi:carbonic anhydrase